MFDELKDESNTTVRLCNEDNTVVFSTNEEELGQKLSSNIAEKINNETTKNFKVDDNLILYDKCENGWSIVNEIPKEYILKEISITGIFTTVVALVCIVFTSLLGYKLSKQITNPLNRLVDKMKMAESGNLTVKVQESGTGDEIDVLCTSFNNMISQINELIKSTKSVVDVVKDEVENIKYMSNQTYEISNGVSTAMQDIASGTLEQVNELESTSETMDSLAKSINKIIVNVESVNSISKDTKKIGDDSLKVVKELRDKTDNTNIIMDDINKHIAELVESIKEVEKVF